MRFAPRPLDRLSSIKVKLGVVIVATVAGTVLVLVAGLKLGLSLELRTITAAVIALGLVQFLARGMTSPLREMRSKPVRASRLSKSSGPSQFCGPVLRRRPSSDARRSAGSHSALWWTRRRRVPGWQAAAAQRKHAWMSVRSARAESTST